MRCYLVQQLHTAVLCKHGVYERSPTVRCRPSAKRATSLRQLRAALKGRRRDNAPFYGVCPILLWYIYRPWRPRWPAAAILSASREWTHCEGERGFAGGRGGGGGGGGGGSGAKSLIAPLSLISGAVRRTDSSPHRSSATAPCCCSAPFRCPRPLFMVEAWRHRPGLGSRSLGTPGPLVLRRGTISFSVGLGSPPERQSAGGA